MKERIKFDLETIRGIRNKRGLTQMDIARVTGLTLMTVLNFEKGKKEPRLSTVQKIANALDLVIEIE